jgi:hypothetical protein
MRWNKFAKWGVGIAVAAFIFEAIVTGLIILLWYFYG